MSNDVLSASSEAVRELAEECPDEAAVILEMLEAAEVDSED